jgi:hypothetical protein
MSTMSRVAVTLGLALGASAAKNSIVAPTGAETLTVALLGGRCSVSVNHKQLS